MTHTKVIDQTGTIIATVHFHKMNRPEVAEDRVSIRVAAAATDAEIFAAARAHLIGIEGEAYAARMPTAVLVEKSRF